jgi:hypothetical protein
MYLAREILHCKPGHVKNMVAAFQELGKLLEKRGLPKFRIMTDVAGERFWTVIAEQEVKDLDEHAQLARQAMSDPDIQRVMKNYHDYVESGRREFYKIEG